MVDLIARLGFSISDRIVQKVLVLRELRGGEDQRGVGGRIGRAIFAQRLEVACIGYDRCKLF
jgi:hypothetical protein